VYVGVDRFDATAEKTLDEEHAAAERITMYVELDGSPEPDTQVSVTECDCAKRPEKADTNRNVINSFISTSIALLEIWRIFLHLQSAQRAFQSRCGVVQANFVVIE
jgi:hypothetical protein